MEQKSFHYTYSAQQQEEIQKIRQKYLPQEEDQMERLRRLDRSVSRKGTLVSLSLGVIGTLVMGFGMSCVLVWNRFIPGTLIGIAGIVLLALAYPLYSHIIKKERERLAPEILRLTDELMGR